MAKLVGLDTLVIVLKSLKKYIDSKFNGVNEVLNKINGTPQQ